jgi:uncharacterized Fe-S center protein
MASQVVFHDAVGSARKNRLDKLREVFERAGLAKAISAGDKVAIKLHWGESGNVGFLPVPYARTIVELVRQAGGSPFVTDTNTLYTGSRRNAVDNLQAAARNGYTAESLGAPLIVADGLLGHDHREVALSGTRAASAKIASGILDADALICLSHVKAHMLFGFGGTIKNLGMGCTPPAGKQHLHSDIRPVVDESACCGDGLCVKRCPLNCIALVDRTAHSAGGSKRIARIDLTDCTGCGECTATCPHAAIPIRWKTSSQAILHKTAEVALAALQGKSGKVGFVNCMINITPDCDCCSWNEPAFVSDVGFAASVDPVALDLASAELVCQTPPNPAGKAAASQGDPWRAVYDVDYREIFRYGQKIGLGSTDYELVRLR